MFWKLPLSYKDKDFQGITACRFLSLFINAYHIENQRFVMFEFVNLAGHTDLLTKYLSRHGTSKVQISTDICQNSLTLNNKSITAEYDNGLMLCQIALFVIAIQCFAKISISFLSPVCSRKYFLLFGGYFFKSIHLFISDSQNYPLYDKCPAILPGIISSINGNSTVGQSIKLEREKSLTV